MAPTGVDFGGNTGLQGGKRPEGVGEISSAGRNDNRSLAAPLLGGLDPSSDSAHEKRHKVEPAGMHPVSDALQRKKNLETPNNADGTPVTGTHSVKPKVETPFLVGIPSSVEGVRRRPSADAESPSPHISGSRGQPSDQSSRSSVILPVPQSPQTPSMAKKVPKAQAVPKFNIPNLPNHPTSPEPEKPPMRHDSESLDYEPVQNAVGLRRLKKEKAQQKRHIYGYSGRTFVKFVITIHAGVVIGLIAIAIGWSTASMIEWKNGVIMSLYHKSAGSSFANAMFFHIAYSCVLVVFAIVMVQYWAPTAAGAGVSLVMAYLNGNHVPNLFHLKALVAKFIGTVCALSANLFMGPEGPMVHMGAAVASVLTYMECWGCCLFRKPKPSKLYISAEPTLQEPLTGSASTSLLTTSPHKDDVGYIMNKWKTFCDFMVELYSDLDRREFLSAGAAAGIAAAFGAPVGGVLFSMEEAATYWSRKVAWRCFLCAVAAVMTLNWLHPLLGPHCDPTTGSTCSPTEGSGMLSFEKGVELKSGDWLEQLPFILGISVIVGILGSVFNSSRILLWRVRAQPKMHFYRVMEGVILVLTTVIVMFVLSISLGRCEKILDTEWNSEKAYMRFNCKEGEHNDLASAFLSSPEITIKRLFSLGSENEDEESAKYTKDQFFNSHFTISSLWTFVPAYLIVMSLGSGIAIPGGLFMPAIMLGAATGGLYGRLMHKLASKWNYNKIQPGFYALIGATGSLASVFRSSISLVVIVIEGTRNIDYLFGVIVAVVISNWVAHHVHHDGIYESEIERAGNVHFLKPEPPRSLCSKTAEQIMASDVYGFSSIEKVSYVLKVLKDTTHNGFPVFAPEERDAHGEVKETSTGVLEGLILRSQLLVMLRRRVFCDAEGNPLTHVNEEEVDAEMRRFYRIQHTHHRFMATTEEMVDELELDWVHNLLTPRYNAQSAQRQAPDFGSNFDRPGLRNVLGLPVNCLYLDLRPYMNRAPLTVRQECSGERAYQVFTSLGLRHLCVVSDHNQVVGLITRKDLDHASGHGWWRTTKIAPGPERHNILFRNIQTGIARSMKRFPSLLRRQHSAENLLNANGHPSKEDLAPDDGNVPVSVGEGASSSPV